MVLEFLGDKKKINSNSITKKSVTKRLGLLLECAKKIQNWVDLENAVSNG